MRHLRRGFAVIRIGDDIHRVDTNRFDVDFGEPVVRMHRDGRLSVGTVIYEGH